MHLWLRLGIVQSNKFVGLCLRRVYKCLPQANALRGQLQSFAIALAKLCVGTCKAFRWRLQSFA